MIDRERNNLQLDGSYSTSAVYWVLEREHRQADPAIVSRILIARDDAIRAAGRIADRGDRECAVTDVDARDAIVIDELAAWSRRNPNSNSTRAADRSLDMETLLFRTIVSRTNNCPDPSLLG